MLPTTNGHLLLQYIITEMPRGSVAWWLPLENNEKTHVPYFRRGFILWHVSNAFKK